MMNMLLFFFISMIISFLIIIINIILSKMNLKNREKITPFECGFDPITHSRLPFSIQFFMITLMFLIFDIEIMLITPIIPLIKFFPSIYMNLTFSLFLFILITSLWMEWSFMYLNWID